MDGGQATQMEANGLDISDQLWSKIAPVKDQPEEVKKVHSQFIQAGA